MGGWKKIDGGEGRQSNAAAVLPVACVGLEGG